MVIKSYDSKKRRDCGHAVSFLPILPTGTRNTHLTDVVKCANFEKRPCGTRKICRFLPVRVLAILLGKNPMDILNKEKQLKLYKTEK